MRKDGEFISKPLPCSFFLIHFVLRTVSEALLFFFLDNFALFLHYHFPKVLNRVMIIIIIHLTFMIIQRKLL